MSNYVFSEMSEKDYLLKKTEIEAKLKDLKKKKPATPRKIDDDFLKMASYFLINNEFMKRKKVDFRTIIDNVDKDILKDFLKTIIHEVNISDGKAVSIVYANGSVVVITD